MQKWNDWTKWIEEAPNWIRNTIGFMTLIISFVLLFRTNLDLSILVSAAVALIFLLLLSVYVIFSKIKSSLIGGGFIYRFPVARKWALVMIVPIITSTIFVVSHRTTRDVIATIFLSQQKAVDCRIVLGLSRGSTDLNTDDISQILALIETETTAVLYNDIDQVMSIFTNDSLIVDSTSGKQWKGCDDIYSRYEDLQRFVSFTTLKQIPTEGKINGSIATVETLSVSTYDTKPVPYVTMAVYNQNSEGINRWTFLKYRGIWKVKTFVYDLQFRKKWP